MQQLEFDLDIPAMLSTKEEDLNYKEPETVPYKAFQDMVLSMISYRQKYKNWCWLKDSKEWNGYFKFESKSPFLMWLGLKLHSPRIYWLGRRVHWIEGVKEGLKNCWWYASLG